MPIHSLKSTSLPTIVDALLRAFEGYFVQLPASLEYWGDRLKAARYDADLSFGWWEEGELVGFILHGIDMFHGQKTAFNTGTGVVDGFRGRGMVDALYDHAIPVLKANGVQQCCLEVIKANERAIRVYERIGMQKTRSLRCFKGEVVVGDGSVTVTEVGFEALNGLPGREWDSWDNCDAAIVAGLAVYRCYRVTIGSGVIGYFVVNPKSGNLPRVEVLEEGNLDHWQLMIEGIAQVTSLARINNVDDRREAMVRGLLSTGLSNPVDQWEMGMGI